jgi:hypothetical protein
LKVLFVPGLEVVTEEVLAALNRLRSRGIARGEEFVLSCAVRDTSRNTVSTVLPVEVILTADR